MSIKFKLLLVCLAALSLLFWIYFTKIAIFGFVIVCLFMYAARDSKHDMDDL